MEYTYFLADEGGYIGFFDIYPDWWTQGETLEDLEAMLADLYNEHGSILTAENTKTELLPVILFHSTIEINVLSHTLA
ncbi:type II toxin-antitoxin system HicB family antitoxin [Breznakiellaceae bacterium SP9]